jgi:protein-S-isoprenylcysteine O-methyltransferase Ste14
MNHDVPAYGLWSLVIINAAVFILFAFSFFKPKTARGLADVRHLLRRVLFRAQKEGRLATLGPYAYVRHLQYVAFIVIMFGFLLQWPTLVTLVMFPILVGVYARLARREERDVRAQFGVAWDAYAGRTPAFIPRLRRPQQTAEPRAS